MGTVIMATSKKRKQKNKKYNYGRANEFYSHQPGYVTEDQVREMIPPDSFMDDYFDYVSSVTDAPLWYHYGCLMSAMITAAGFRELRVEGVNPGTYDHVNIQAWQVLIGNSGERKSAAIGPARRVLQEACPNALLSRDGTQEAWHDRLGTEKMGGVGILLRDEFSSILDQASRSYGSNLISWLLESHSGVASRETKSGGLVPIPRVRINMLGGIPPVTFRDKITAHLWATGFLPRMILYFAGRERYLERPSKEDKKEAYFSKYLKAITQGNKQIIISQEVAKKLSDWRYANIDSLTNKVHPNLMSLLVRLEEKAQIFAAMIALSCSSTTKNRVIHVSEDDMGYAMEAIEAILGSILKLFGSVSSNDEAVQENQILDTIEACPGLTARELGIKCDLSYSYVYRLLKLFTEEPNAVIEKKPVKNMGCRSKIGYFTLK